MIHSIQAAEPRSDEQAYLTELERACTEKEFFSNDNRHIEFNDGILELLPMPTEQHQNIMMFFYLALLAFSQTVRPGKPLVSGMKVRVQGRKYKDPDVVFMLNENAGRRGNDYWDAADVVMEVVSEGTKNRNRDYVTKRAEYAQAGIPEYWIVDPQDQKITVLKLDQNSYAVHGEFKPGERATSALLAGFEVDVTAALAGQQ